ncbi:MAG TPA: class IV adenylate cyclase [Candidatus Polarisedimenticolia bacterium]|nr:class IV adenylate cyclase [Candidatus Polarisedimenticolia bacterium]
MDSSGAGIEIEIKLRFASLEEGLSRLAMLPAGLEDVRRLERNEVFDDQAGTLAGEGRLLRLRVAGERASLTFKERVPSDLRAKVRAEWQTMVESPEAARAILLKLGLRVVYRYEKYRSYYGWEDPVTGGNLSISLDETPIGVFVELEGPKASIDRAARAMGLSDDSYLVEDYRSLHEAWRAGRPDAGRDMVFAPREGEP